MKSYQQKAEISIDPSLLLTEDDWDKISRCPVPKEPYIFLFSVRKPIKLISYALELSKKPDTKSTTCKRRGSIRLTV